jgi:hypothetical protein
LRARLAKRIWRDLQDENGQRILQNIRVLRERFEPEGGGEGEGCAPSPRRWLMLSGDRGGACNPPNRKASSVLRPFG